MTDLVAKALAFAFKAHAGQKRKYGDADYIQHPVRVAMRVARLEYAGQQSIAAALLHDVVEDCGIKPEEIVEAFGEPVARIVRELTDVYTKEAFPDRNRAMRKVLEHERLGKISPEAKDIKLADLADNLREIDPNDGFAKLFCEEAEHLLSRLVEGDMYLQTEVEEAIAALRAVSK